MRRIFLVLPLTLILACATASSPDAAAKRDLESTPRHNEWVAIPHDGRTLHAYVTYPERATKAPAIVLIHENRGLTDWERSVADRLSERGYLVIAPDLLSGMAPGGGRASDFASLDAAREAISRLDPAQVRSDLNAAAGYVLALPSANGALSVAGFCWGGARTWDFANDRKGLSAAFVFYGTGPTDSDGVANITAPVYGFFGGNDARIAATLPTTTQLMQSAGKTFEPVTYEGAGHAFMRAGEAADALEPNRRARDEAWKRWLAILGGSAMSGTAGADTLKLASADGAKDSSTNHCLH